MSFHQDKLSGCVLANEPSTSFSSVSSAASATSVGSTRSGGSKLLFGEIDLSSDRSSESYASVCNFVLCESSTFLKFWLEDNCRGTLLSHLERQDLASLRLACHDFSVRAAPALFSDLRITFKASTFTKPAKLAALDRLGFYVKTLKFNLPHSPDTFLPPLVDPDTGAELSFTYTPPVGPNTAGQPKYGDIGTTEILTRQWPPLFHAATNIAAFTRAFSSFVNLARLTISCPGYDRSQRYRRSTVDFALVSLRIAIERNCLNALDSLTLSPIHPSGLLYLSPLLGQGASPRSASRWSRVKHLTIHADTLSPSAADAEPDQFRLLQAYLRNFQSHISTFKFRWIGDKAIIPIQRPQLPIQATGKNDHTDSRGQNLPPRRKTIPALRFPKLHHVEFENVKAASADINGFVEAHKQTLGELNFENVELVSGSWDDALAPLTKLSKKRHISDTAEIPIMLSPSTTGNLFPAPMERLEVAQQHSNGKKSLRMSRWLSARSKTRTPAVAKKVVREGLLECEEQLKKVFRGSVFTSWR